MYKNFKKLTSLLAKTSIVSEKMIVQAQAAQLFSNKTLNEAMYMYTMAMGIDHFPKELAQEFYQAIRQKDIIKIQNLSLEINLLIKELLKK